MTSPFFQGVNPPMVPDPVTPADSPGDPAGYAGVTPHGQGTAPYDISAPQDIAGITGAFTSATGLAGAGVIEASSMGPREAQTKAFLESPQGAPAMSITAGFPDYENTDVNPGANLETPDQGMGIHPGTTQDGLQQYMAGSGGVAGVPPEGGNMGAGGGDYPGATEDGLTQYGTS